MLTAKLIDPGLPIEIEWVFGIKIPLFLEDRRVNDYLATSGFLCCQPSYSFWEVPPLILVLISFISCREVARLGFLGPLLGSGAPLHIQAFQSSTVVMVSPKIERLVGQRLMTGK